MKIDFLSEYKNKIVVISGSAAKLEDLWCNFCWSRLFVYGLDEKN